MKNSIFHISLIFVSVFVSLSSYAQSPDEIEIKMDEIKLDESFIYGEDYNDNKDIAYQNALTELVSSINELRSVKNAALLGSSDLQPLVKELRYTKGSKNLCFLYMPLYQALSLTPKSKSENAVIAGEHLLRDDSKVESEKQKENQQFTFVPNKPSMATPMPDTQIHKDILEILCGQDNWVEIKGFLADYKQQGKIQVGNCTSFDDVPSDAFAILMDDMAGILSIISPKNAANRVNHKTNQPDNENNHANCKFIVWYK